ncbi:hypothetical protein [Acidithiobacillus ferrooxidans]|uniref:hypothetical protein n=1 Tax=Acidithiobacillus ferrooxidans TaxID=920 RepID=UPI000B05F676|nr:hypothetical protein [Acidithiobacillus ferrooxidans]
MSEGKTIDRTSILNGRRLLYGYHIDVVWETASRETLVLKSIAWVDPDEDTAGQVDLVSNRMLWDDVGDEPCWLVSVSNSTGDSFGSTPRSEITHADIFDVHEEALGLVDTLENIVQETSRATIYTMSNKGFVAYRNDHYPRMLDLSHLDGVFDRLDGVFLMQIWKEQVKRWAYSEKEA